MRSNSPSEGSEGTGDEVHGQKKTTKKRSSFRRKKKKQTESDSALVISPPWSDCDLNTSTPGTLYDIKIKVRCTVNDHK